MKISTKTRYGLRIMIYLATQGDKMPTSVKKIADHESITVKYTEQIIRLFMHADLLEVIRGSKGGYVIKKTTLKMTAKDIFVLLEKDAYLIECLDPNGNNCQRQYSCSTFDLWNGLEKVIFDYLSQYTIDNLATSYSNKFKQLMYYI